MLLCFLSEYTNSKNYRLIFVTGEELINFRWKVRVKVSRLM